MGNCMKTCVWTHRHFYVGLYVRLFVGSICRLYRHLYVGVCRTLWVNRVDESSNVIHRLYGHPYRGLYEHLYVGCICRAL